MSLIDPTKRWWNRDTTRRYAAYVCWAVALVLQFVSAMMLWGSTGGTEPLGLLLPATFLPIPLLIAGGFLHTFSRDSDEADSRVIFMPLALLFVAIGLGGLVGKLRLDGTLSIMSLIFAVGGMVALVVIQLVSMRIESNARLRQRVERIGVVTTGTVTRARSFSVNYQPVTRVTVEFVDEQGRTRWASETVGGNARAGERVTVRYSAADLDRKAAVIVSRS